MVFFMSLPFDQIQEEQPKALDISQVKINQVYALLLQRMLDFGVTILGYHYFYLYKPTSNSYNRPNQTFHQCLGEELMISNAEKLFRACLKPMKS